MNYLNAHELGKERMQQFVDEANAYRKARQMGGVESKPNLLMQFRTFLVRTFTLTIR